MGADCLNFRFQPAERKRDMSIISPAENFNEITSPCARMFNYSLKKIPHSC